MVSPGRIFTLYSAKSGFDAAGVEKTAVLTGDGSSVFLSHCARTMRMMTEKAAAMRPSRSHFLLLPRWILNCTPAAIMCLRPVLLFYIASPGFVSLTEPGELAIRPRLGSQKSEPRHVGQHVRVDAEDGVSGLMIVEMGAVGVKRYDRDPLLVKGRMIRSAHPHSLDRISAPERLDLFVGFFEGGFELGEIVAVAEPRPVAFTDHIEVEHRVRFFDPRREVLDEIRGAHEPHFLPAEKHET